MLQRRRIPGADLPPRRGRLAPRGVAHALICLAILGAPWPARAQTDDPARPELRWRVEAPLLVAGATLFLVGDNLSTTRLAVPSDGLDPRHVKWALDRRVVGQRSKRAATHSDRFRDAALVYPMALAIVSEPSGARVKATLRRSLMYGEAILAAEGLSTLIKNSADRPRPFTYLPASQRPGGSAYGVTSDYAFQSMPSGHATVAFCAAGFAIADHLISRPDASWKERVGIGFAGGFLAGTTADLRVEAGQHFPSDVIVGGLIGTTTGVAVPLVHHYVGAGGGRATLPSGRAWRQAILGEAAGIAAGILVAHTH